MNDDKTTLSIYFDEDRTYCLLMRDEDRGFALQFIQSTDAAFSISDSYDGHGNKQGRDQIRSILSTIGERPDRITVCLPMESVFVHQFPAPLSLAGEEVRKLVRFEISQHFPDKNYEHFRSQAFPLAARLDDTRMMLAVIMDRKITESVNALLRDFGIVDHIAVGQLAVHEAFLYNYPEHVSQTVAIIGVQGRYLDISVLKNGQAAYLHTLHYNDEDELIDGCEAEFKNILEDYVAYLDGAYVFGSNLTVDILSAMQARLSIPVKRFNALRMMSTTLDARAREYCGRIAHIIAPCVGCGLPRTETGILI